MVTKLADLFLNGMITVGTGCTADSFPSDQIGKTFCFARQGLLYSNDSSKCQRQLSAFAVRQTMASANL
jgi:hypothetical protein